jgi:hypothetical protein
MRGAIRVELDGVVRELQASDVVRVTTLDGEVRVMTAAELSELAEELLEANDENARLEGGEAWSLADAGVSVTVTPASAFRITVHALADAF